MRLLDARTLQFAEFVREDETPKYAILSHIWEHDEVTFKDMNENRTQAVAKHGFRKIRFCAEQAVKDGLGYFWVDTCCIDKSSSAEVSEAINSTFRRYRNSNVCYAFLSDAHISASTPHATDRNEVHYLEEMAKSRWFTRSWTLPELVAPRRLGFFSQEWRPLGSKDRLCRAIEGWTKIPANVLTSGDYTQYSIAQRMSWAANRQTTRVEDMAYSLLGLFNIIMSIIYGEGEKAFIRLQEEIIKDSDDATIFAWKDRAATWATYRGLLASSVSHFAACSQITWQPRQDDRNPIYIYPPTRESKSKLPRMRMTADGVDNNTYITLLPGVCEATTPDVILGMMISDIGQGQYARLKEGPTFRVRRDAFESNRLPLVETSFFVRQKIVLEHPMAFAHSRAGGLVLNLSEGVRLLGIMLARCWDGETNTMLFRAPADVDKYGRITIRIHSSVAGMIILVVDLLKEWGRVVQVREGGQIDTPGAEILRIFSNPVFALEAGAVENQVMHARLGAPDLLHSVQISFSRGLIKDRWMFRLGVKAVAVAGAVPPPAAMDVLVG